MINLKKTLKKLLLCILVLSLALTIVSCGFNNSGDSDGPDSSDSDSDDYVYIPTVSPYVSMVKEAKHSSYGITYGAAFNSFFSNPEWSYFKASTGDHVVEFEGGFSYDNSPATAKIQFIIDLAEGTFSAHHLSINGVAQNKLMLATLIKKVFESY